MTPEELRHMYITPHSTQPTFFVWCGVCLAVVDQTMVAPHMLWHERTNTL
jgi:hypothetical protein